MFMFTDSRRPTETFGRLFVLRSSSFQGLSLSEGKKETFGSPNDSEFKTFD